MVVNICIVLALTLKEQTGQTSKSYAFSYNDKLGLTRIGNMFHLQASSNLLMVKKRGGTCPRNSGKIFLVNYHVKFGQFSGKYHVKFGHFVNFSYTFGQKCLAPKVDLVN